MADCVDFRRELWRHSVSRSSTMQPAAKLIGQFVDEAGKDSAAKRQRLRLAVSLAEEFYRAVLLAIRHGPGNQRTPNQREAVSKRPSGCRRRSGDSCLDVCLDAYAHIDANANQATLIEWWLDELASALARGAWRRQLGCSPHSVSTSERCRRGCDARTDRCPARCRAATRRPRREW